MADKPEEIRVAMAAVELAKAVHEFNMTVKADKYGIYTDLEWPL